MPDEPVEALLAEARTKFEADVAELAALSDDELAEVDAYVTDPEGEVLECDEDTPKLTDDEWQFILDVEAGADG